MMHRWAINSVGRVSALQAGSRRFEPVIAHHFFCFKAPHSVSKLSHFSTLAMVLASSRVRNLIFILITLSLSSCGKDRLAYFHEHPEEARFSKTYSIKDLSRGEVEIILVFDVSGSMMTTTPFVIEGMKEALKILTTYRLNIRWKLAMLGSIVHTKAGNLRKS